MRDVEITYEDQGSKTRYAVRLPDREGEGELTLSRLSESRVIADHTAVPDSLRGTGAARALVERLVADAWLQGFRIVPLCPYVRALAQRHRDDWSDVFEF